MRVVVFLLLLSSLLPCPARAQLWRYPDPCPATDTDSWGGGGDWNTTPPAQPAKQPPCRPRPVIPHYTVSPDSVELVLRCQNRLRLPKNLNGLCFTAEGATVKLDLPQHELLLVPMAERVKLTVWRGTQVIEAHTFAAVPPPLPEVKYLFADCEATVCRPNRGVAARNASLRAVPDQAFANVMPEDARYRVNRYEIVLLRNGTALGVPLVVNGPDADLRTITSSMQEGDQLQIDVKQVLRMNFQGQIEEMPLPQRRLYTLRQRYERLCLELTK